MQGKVILANVLQLSAFSRRCLGHMAHNPRLFILFMSLSVASALTEGVGVSLIVPLLDSINPTAGRTAFAGIPILGTIGQYFATIDGEWRIIALSGTMAAVLLARGALQYSVDFLGSVIPLRLLDRFARESFADLLAVEMAYINNANRGDLFAAVNGYPGRVTLLLTNFAALLAATFVLATYSILMIVVSWQMTLMALAFVSAMFFFLRRFTAGPVRQAGQSLSNAQVELGALVQESVGGMKLIRLSGAEKQIYERFCRALGRQVTAQRHMAAVATASSPFFSTCAGLFICVLLSVASLINAGNDATWVGGILMFVFLLFRMLGPVSAINNSRVRILSDLDALDRLEEFREDARKYRQPDGDKSLPTFARNVIFKDVSFAYGNDSPVLRSLSFTMERGELVAVVGPSGAGKSTLASLLARLHDPVQGSILIDGTDLREYRVGDWRRQISFVTQDGFIFNDTVTNNICFPHTDIPQEKVAAAARMAAADTFIESLPQGYDTPLGDRGVRLSGGQQQRIAIARAILADPAILIMDEATSHLDSVTEHQIQGAVDNLSRNRTMLVIAHRLSTVRKADRIIVLVNGSMVEHGRHTELIERKGMYWEMLMHQQLDLIDDDDEAAADQEQSKHEEQA